MTIATAAVHGWLAAGLAVAGAAAFLVVWSPVLMGALVFNPGALLGLSLATVALAVWLWGRGSRWSAPAAGAALLATAALTGTAVAAVLVAYAGTGIAPTFGVCAAAFAAAAAYGAATRRDIAGAGAFVAVGAPGFVLGTVAHGLLRSPALDWVLTASAVLIFALLAAYCPPRGPRSALGGALALYLDFVTLFLVFPWLFRRHRT